VAQDVEWHGQQVPEGSAMLLLVASANRDDRRYPDGDRFDIHREFRLGLTFGRGIHYCLGAALARLEGRIALEEILKRFPEWDVDTGSARLAPTSTVRGWESLPVRTRSARTSGRDGEIADCAPSRAAGRLRCGSRRG
jgi:cytochrome P450